MASQPSNPVDSFENHNAGTPAPEIFHSHKQKKDKFAEIDKKVLGFDEKLFGGIVGQLTGKGKDSPINPKDILGGLGLGG